MKPRAVQISFVVASLLLAGLIVHQGHLTLMPPALAQDAATGPSRAASMADRKAAIAVIGAQLKALQKGNYPQVLQYQSSGLRHHFGSVAAFRRMMETHYPAFLTFQSVAYGPASTPDGGRHLAIPVTLRKGNGVKLPALYILVREGTGYKVDGVEGAMAPPPGATGGPSQVT